MPGTEGLGPMASHLVISIRPTRHGSRRRVGRRMRSLQPWRVYVQLRLLQTGFLGSDKGCGMSVQALRVSLCA